MSTIHSAFTNQLIGLISIPIVFGRFFSWIALGDVYLFLTHVGKKSQCCRRENSEWHIQYHTCDVDWINWTELNSIQLKVHELHGYITNIIHPYIWLMVWLWHHILLACYRRYVWTWITYAKSHSTVNCHMYSRSGVIT
jgi:hypothetical protein